MKKLLGMSNLGYVIILLLIIAIGMIISTPMIINNTMSKAKNSDKDEQQENMVYSNDKNENDYENNEPEYMDDHNSGKDNNSQNYDTSEVRDLEQRLNSRIASLENRQDEFIDNLQSKTDITNKYVCYIDGYLDSENNVVPIEHQKAVADLKSQKFVFICQYK